MYLVYSSSLRGPLENRGAGSALCTFAIAQISLKAFLAALRSLLVPRGSLAGMPRLASWARASHGAFSSGFIARHLSPHSLATSPSVADGFAERASARPM